MPVSIPPGHDPFQGPAPRRRAASRSQPTASTVIRTPQARVLRALYPTYPEDPSWDWPLVTRTKLCVRAGYTVISGTVTRALNGIRQTNRTSGDPHPGVIELGWVEVVMIDIEGVMETNYRITQAGIAAYDAFIAGGGSLPPVKDADICTNHRHRD
jgi:hypothetical protein